MNIEQAIQSLPDERIARLYALALYCRGTAKWESIAGMEGLPGIEDLWVTDRPPARHEDEQDFWAALLELLDDEVKRRRQPEAPSGERAFIVEEDEADREG